MKGHTENELWGLDTHPTKPLAASCSDDYSLRVWDLTPGKCKLARYKRLQKQARTCAFSPDGRYLALGFRDGSFVVLNLEADDMPEIAAFKDHKEEISDMKFSPGICTTLFFLYENNSYILKSLQ